MTNNKRNLVQEFTKRSHIFRSVSEKVVITFIRTYVQTNADKMLPSVEP